MAQYDLRTVSNVLSPYYTTRFFVTLGVKPLRLSCNLRSANPISLLIPRHGLSLSHCSLPWRLVYQLFFWKKLFKS